MKRYHLIGIGGIGMCGLAQILAHEGISVSGSDRVGDIGLFRKLEGLGIRIYPQDGSGIGKGVSKVIISRAIEENNPDLIMAKKLKIPVSYRQDELKKIFRRYSGIAVAGTSGKTTVVGMIGCIFDTAGQDITVVNGGIMRNYITHKNIGNVHIGRLPSFCVETDESEGDLRGYNPEIGVITNIGSDHMPFGKLRKVYKDFASQVKEKLILNGDIKAINGGNPRFPPHCAPHFLESAGLSPPSYAGSTIGLREKYIFPLRIPFGFDETESEKFRFIKAEAIELHPSHSIFRVNGHRIRLRVPGLHNIHNALAAMGVAYAWGISPRQAVRGLERFKGIKRRFELVMETDGIRIIDDYAHNPDKIRAALETARLGEGRIIAIYQPHGYRPTKMFLSELARAFNDNLDKRDYLFIPKIYYAGGKAKKDISSSDLAKKIKRAEYIPDRDDIKAKVKKIVKHGDTVLVMGARDNTLHMWAKGLLQ